VNVDTFLDELKAQTEELAKVLSTQRARTKHAEELLNQCRWQVQHLESLRCDSILDEVAEALAESEEI
jgi:hypothetical protein